MGGGGVNRPQYFKNEALDLKIVRQDQSKCREIALAAQVLLPNG